MNAEPQAAGCGDDFRNGLSELAVVADPVGDDGSAAAPEIDETFMLRKLPGAFVAGEMIDWEAPTGGYLLQACFATGRAAGVGAARWAAGSKSA